MPRQRSPVLTRDDVDTCASCGSHENLERSARFGEIPFCRECIDRSFHVEDWDDLGDPGA
ncbi:hypothetical protein [Plesiocystis pacifica]|uniref:hypothetical protein n=1 Tax=Plesiocystis pacifica TaxID=191768 RepID=UPI0012F8CAA8|nr:hypothetical protein [Plesiocystis pacifica]